MTEPTQDETVPSEVMDALKAMLHKRAKLQNATIAESQARRAFEASQANLVRLLDEHGYRSPSTPVVLFFDQPPLALAVDQFGGVEALGEPRLVRGTIR